MIARIVAGVIIGTAVLAFMVFAIVSVSATLSRMFPEAP